MLKFRKLLGGRAKEGAAKLRPRKKFRRKFLAAGMATVIGATPLHGAAIAHAATHGKTGAVRISAQRIQKEEPSGQRMRQGVENLLKGGGIVKSLEIGIARNEIEKLLNMGDSMRLKFAKSYAKQIRKFKGGQLQGELSKIELKVKIIDANLNHTFFQAQFSAADRNLKMERLTEIRRIYLGMKGKVEKQLASKKVRLPKSAKGQYRDNRDWP